MSKSPKQKLSERAIDALRPFFPDLDFAEIRIHSGIPWPISLNRGVTGYAAGNKIYLRKDYFSKMNSSDPKEYARALGLIAHELIHTQQFRKQGRLGFYGTYGFDYVKGLARSFNHDQAYRNIRQEKEAYEIGDRILAALNDRADSEYES
ncbi:DUF4157 domain-containing protein [bacterium AH-315-P07]|nr:DUF4157 domain-containing protein [bacterium AH-315-P07]